MDYDELENSINEDEESEADNIEDDDINPDGSMASELDYDM